MASIVWRAVAVAPAIAVVVACAQAPTGQLLTPPPAVETGTAAIRPDPTTAPAETFATGSLVAQTPRAASPSPVGSAVDEPVESLPAPATLNRHFEDTDRTRQIREMLVASYIEPVVDDDRVVAAMRAVPRHAFVPAGQLDEAYDDHPLPIEAGQTISQPSLVAQMTAALEVSEGDRVLEIGTGSGYQAAILAQLTDDVYSVEIIPELASIGRAVLDRVGADRVRVRRADGYFGWPEHAPYDAIIVTAAPDHLPSPLVQQLKPDAGRLVIPIGPVGDIQTLWLVTRRGEEVDMQDLGEVQFVPFTREDGS